MVTTNISLPRNDWRTLKLLAVEHGVSMSELIRRSISKLLTKLESPAYGSPEWWTKANLEALKEIKTEKTHSFDSLDEVFNWLES